MRELWTEFGELDEIWLDGGCGSLCDRVNQLLGELQPRALVFNGCGVAASPVRWCGSETGDLAAWPTVWSTATCDLAPSSLSEGVPPDTPGAVFAPSGSDNTLQQNDHWFWVPGVPVHSLSQLVDWYHKSVGTNGHWELDVAIDRTGRVADAHARAYAALGAWIRSCYGAPVAAGSLAQGATEIVVALPSSATLVDRVMLREDQSRGQLIATYAVDVWDAGRDAWVPFSGGTSIGSRRIDVATAPVVASRVRARVLSGYALPAGLSLGVFAPEPCALAPFAY